MARSEIDTLLIPGDSSAMRFAAESLARDIRDATGRSVRVRSSERERAGADGSIVFVESDDLGPEEFRISPDDTGLLARGGDDLAMAYAAYRLSHDLLGVDPYRHFNVREPRRVGRVEADGYSVTGRPPAVRYRGVFVNDEDLLMGAHREIGIPLSTWQELFETILRLGYNTVIPGSGIDPSDGQLDLAHEMGLFITQHHAEPLGAPMFSDRFDGDVPRWPQDRDRMELLYREAVESQRHRRVVWTLGFRGQGDVAFYESDGGSYTPAERGRVISEVIAFQKRIVDDTTGAPQEYVHNVYAESAELLRDGHLVLPEGVIPVYADNGYGAMRMRRQGLAPEEHVSSLPPEGHDPVGVYYHVQFHDLQAASKLVSVISPSLIGEQTARLFERGGLRYAVNNIGPLHGLLLPAELVARILHGGPLTGSGIRDFVAEFVSRYLPNHVAEAVAVLDAFYAAPARFGELADQVAGDQIHHDPVCAAIRGVLRGESTVEWFQFLDPVPTAMREALEGIHGVIEPSLPRWHRVAEQAVDLAGKLHGAEARFVTSFLVVPSRYMALCAGGAVTTVSALLAYLDRDYKTAFIDAAAAHQSYRNAWSTLVSSVSGRFQHLYRGEWETDTRETIRMVRTLVGMARIMGDWRGDWWRSEWVIDAIRPRRVAGSLVSQASLRYIPLADALRTQRDCSHEDYFDMLLIDEREPDD